MDATSARYLTLYGTKYVFAHALSLVPILTQIFLKEIDFYMIIQPRE